MVNSIRGVGKLGIGTPKRGLNRLRNMPKIAIGLALLSVMTACASPQPENRTQISKPAETSQAPAPAPTEAITAFECAKIERGVTVIETLFAEGTATTGQSMALLEATADDWGGVAKNYAGSKADWLNKMAELARGVSTYLDNGSGDGNLLLDQLYANMGLASQYC